MVCRDLRGQKPFVTETLPHPDFQSVFEKNFSTVNGVSTGKFSRSFEGFGTAFGIKFKPGAFRPLLHAPASSLRNRSVPASAIFDQNDVGKLDAMLVSSTEGNEKVETAQSFLHRCHPGPDPSVSQARSWFN